MYMKIKNRYTKPENDTNSQLSHFRLYLLISLLIKNYDIKVNNFFKLIV